MPSRVVAATLTTMLAASSCFGAVRWFANDYEGAQKLAKDTGWPIMVAFVVKGDSNVKELKRLFTRPQLTRFARAFFFCYVELEIVNNQVNSRILAKFKHQGQIRFPCFYFVDANDAVLTTTMDKSPDNLDLQFKLAYKRHGPVADPKSLKEALTKLKQADALSEKGQAGAAAALYQEIVAMGFKAPPVEAATAKLAQIEQTANQQLEDARADLKAKAYAQAVDKLAELERHYGSLKAGQEAHQELARLRQMPEAKDAFAQLARRAAETPKDPTAPVAITEAEWKIDGFTDEELDALDAMAAGTEPAEAKPDAAQGDAVARKCRRLLGLARNWIANKQPDKARTLLQQVIDQHGDTLYAEQARAILSGIK